MLVHVLAIAWAVLVAVAVCFHAKAPALTQANKCEGDHWYRHMLMHVAEAHALSQAHALAVCACAYACPATGMGASTGRGTRAVTCKSTGTCMGTRKGTGVNTCSRTGTGTCEIARAGATARERCLCLCICLCFCACVRACALCTCPSLWVCSFLGMCLHVWLCPRLDLCLRVSLRLCLRLHLVSIRQDENRELQEQVTAVDHELRLVKLQLHEARDRQRAADEMEMGRMHLQVLEKEADMERLKVEHLEAFARSARQYDERVAWLHRKELDRWWALQDSLRTGWEEQEIFCRRDLMEVPPVMRVGASGLCTCRLCSVDARRSSCVPLHAHPRPLPNLPKDTTGSQPEWMGPGRFGAQGGLSSMGHDKVFLATVSRECCHQFLVPTWQGCPCQLSWRYQATHRVSD